MDRLQITHVQADLPQKMDTLKLTLLVLVAVPAIIAALMSVLLFIRLRWPAPLLWITKLFISALSPWLTLLGVIASVVGLITGSALISLVGAYNALIFYIHMYRVTRPPEDRSGFEFAFGEHWQDRIGADQEYHFLPSRTAAWLPSVPDPLMKANVCFGIVPETGRELQCDIWQPSQSVPSSGLAFIYLHGSAFYLLDKDCGTRPLFRHLAAQGHVVMDVAYRLAPETNILGMVHDVNRAIHWMKENADEYHVHPGKIVLGGGSAGGHLALLAAYTSQDLRFIPEDLQGKDLNVCSVVSLYGTNDLEAHYYHTNQHLTTRSIPGRPKKKVPTKMPDWIRKRMGSDFHRLGFDKGFVNAGALAPLLGGHPDECPDTYALFSPITHVHDHCPPTLLVHGEHDLMAPVRTTRLLNARLAAVKVPTIMHILPQTDHAFDLVLPNLSPSAHNAIYDLERFLALQVENFEYQPSAGQEVMV